MWATVQLTKFLLVPNIFVLFIIVIFILSLLPLCIDLYGLRRWRPLNGRPWLCAAIWLRAKMRDRGLGLRPRLYVGSVCDDSASMYRAH